MNRTETELREIYRDLPAIDEAEARLLARLERGDFSVEHRPAARSWAAAGVSAATVAALATTVAVVQADHSHHRGTGPLAQTTTGEIPSSPSVTSAPPSDSDPQVGLTPQTAVQTLRALLAPYGSTSAFSGEAFPGAANGELVFDDGHGGSLFTLELVYPYHDPNGTVEKLKPGSLCDPSMLSPSDHCTAGRDGSQVDVFIGPSEPGKPTYWTVTVLRKDSVQIQLSESDTAGEGGPKTRTQPPLSIAQLTALAYSDLWTGTEATSTARADAGLFTPTVLHAPNPNVSSSPTK